MHNYLTAQAAGNPVLHTFPAVRNRAYFPSTERPAVARLGNVVSGDHMGFGEAIRSGFKNWRKFTGRASRSEFWYFFLLYFLGLICLDIVIYLVLGPTANPADGRHAPVAAIAVLATIIVYLAIMFFPMLSLAARRLHDSDKSGWLVLLHLLPPGGIIMLVLYCLPGTDGPNQYGDDPHAPARRIPDVF